MKRYAHRGFSLVSAIFLLVVLSALGAVMVSLSNTEHFTTTYTLQSARAYYAARSGVEWGVRRALNGTCSAATLNHGGALGNFTVSITCARTQHTESLSTYWVYTLQSTATSTTPAYGQPGYASRVLTVTFTDA